jgi:hypothetical protein
MAARACEAITAISCYAPAIAIFLPSQSRHSRVEKRIVIELVLFGNLMRLLQNLLPVRILLRRHVASLLRKQANKQVTDLLHTDKRVLGALVHKHMWCV